MALKAPIIDLPEHIPCYNWGIGSKDPNLLEALGNRPRLERLSPKWLGGREGQSAFLLRPDEVRADGPTVVSEWVALPPACSQNYELFLIIRSIFSARFRLNRIAIHADESDLGHRVWYALPLPMGKSTLDMQNCKMQWDVVFSVETSDQDAQLTRWSLSTTPCVRTTT